MLNWPPKDPDEVLDYQMNWTKRLAGDTIMTSVWTVPDGITKDSDDFGPSLTVIWLSGGTLGERYTLTNRITTAGGRTMDQSARLRLVTK